MFQEKEFQAEKRDLVQNVQMHVALGGGDPALYILQVMLFCSVPH